MGHEKGCFPSVFFSVSPPVWGGRGVGGACVCACVGVCMCVCACCMDANATFMEGHINCTPARPEYVALEKLESIYSNVRYIQPNGICCVANPEKMYVVAVSPVPAPHFHGCAEMNNIPPSFSFQVAIILTPLFSKYSSDWWGNVDDFGVLCMAIYGYTDEPDVVYMAIRFMQHESVIYLFIVFFTFIWFVYVIWFDIVFVYMKCNIQNALLQG